MFYDIEQTNCCNLKCVSCPNPYSTRKKGFMKPELFKNIIDQILEHDPEGTRRRICLHGLGNPLLSPHFFENLDYLQEKGFTNIDFSDNGTLMTKEVAERMTKYDIFNGFIKFSLNSSRKEIMEKIQTGAKFEEVAENIRNFLKINEKNGNKVNTYIQLMQTRLNEDESEIELRTMFPGKWKFLLKRINNVSGQIPENEFTYEGEIFLNGACVFGELSIMIHWDGDLVGCCDDDTKTQVIGNAVEGIFDPNGKIQNKITRWKRMLSERDFSELPLCKKCLGL